MSWWIKDAKDIAEEIKKHTDNEVGVAAAAGYVAGVGTAAGKKGVDAIGNGARKVASIPRVVKENKKIDKENRGASRDVPGEGDRETSKRKSWWKSDED